MRYRNRTEIISQILDAANDLVGITKTKLMYKSFLSHGPLEGYLAILTESDLIHYDSISRTFKTTEKGRKFLQIYTQIDDMMKPSQPQSPSAQQQTSIQKEDEV